MSKFVSFKVLMAMIIFAIFGVAATAQEKKMAVFDSTGSIDAMTSADHSKFFVGIVGGINTMIFRDTDILGLNAAYFVNQNVGFGFAGHFYQYRYGDGEYDPRHNYGYGERKELAFMGPVLYSSIGKRNWKLYFPVNIGLGVFWHNYFDYSDGSLDYFEDRYNGFTFGGMLSAGIACQVTDFLSIGVYGEELRSLPSQWYTNAMFITFGLNFHF